jgi:broad specificity phosphatase PhoE/HEAT repeat protein
MRDDEHSLTIGDGLRGSIDDALASSEFGVVILSSTYLQKQWTMAELDGLIALQRLGRKVILPVWHGVSATEVSQKCPTLANLVAADTVNGISYTADTVARVVKEQLKGGSVSPDPNYALKSEGALSAYKANLIADIQNNLVLELYEKSQYEDICLTPLIRSLEGTGTSVHNIVELVDAPRSAIIGEPGSGKTTALRVLALDLMRRTPLNIIPIYLSLAAFGSDSGHARRSTFEDFANDELGVLGCESLDLLKRQAKDGLVFLLDGWDEITEESIRTEIKRYLNLTDAHFIVTSRPEVQRTLPAAERYEMFPLSLERIREFIRLRLRDERQVDTLHHWIAGDSALQTLASNPLNLSILGIVFSEEGQMERVSRTKLYDRAFDTILNQHHRAGGSSHGIAGQIIVPQVDAVLQRLAYRTLKSGGGRFFSLHELQQSIKDELGAVRAEFTELLAGRLGVIRDRRSGRFEFFHAWYQEFLAAKYMINADLDLVAEFGDPSVASALPYAVGLVGAPSDAEQFMSKIPIHDIFIFCRALPEGGFRYEAMSTLLKRVIDFGEQSNPPIPVRVELGKALTQAGGAAVDSLFTLCRSESESGYARRAALEALSQMDCGPNFDKLLVSLMQTASTGLLWHVIEHIGNRRVEGAVPSLRSYTTDTDPITAGDSVWALHQLGEPQGAGADAIMSGLLQCLAAEDRHVQGHALRTLGRLRVKSSLPALRHHLSDVHAPYRWIVPEAAVLIDESGALEILHVALEDNDPRVRAASLQALGQISQQVPQSIVELVERSVTDSTWIPFLEQSIGTTARATLARLQKQTRIQIAPTIYVARHCTTAWNRERRLQGTKDLDLSLEGRCEATQNLPALQELGIQRVASSSAKRAMQTAEIYANGLGVPLQTSPRFRELDHGDWEGQRVDDLLNTAESGYKHWLEDPSAMNIPGSHETAITAQQRILEGVRELAMAYDGETVLLVAHKHILAILSCGLQEVPLSQFEREIVESTLPVRISEDAVCRLRIATGQQTDSGALKAS